MRQIVKPIAAIVWLALSLSPITACNGSSLGNAPVTTSTATPSGEAQAVAPPFEVKGDLDGLMLSWFDAQGLHNANKRSEVPEHRRAQVRVDSLSIAPEQRLDANLVYVADLRSALADGSYPVQTMERATFDALVDKAAGVSINVAPTTPNADEPNAGQPQAATADGPTNQTPVVIYMASWCGACKATAAYLRQRGVAFVERDIEKDRNAQAEMQQKARAAGVSPRGVPVIDFRGTLVLGFDKAQLSQLIDRTTI